MLSDLPVGFYAIYECKCPECGVTFKEIAGFADASGANSFNPETVTPAQCGKCKCRGRGFTT